MVTKFCILGGGAMGTACASLLAEKSENLVSLWVRNPEYADDIRSSRENVRLLPGIKLPDSVNVTPDQNEALHGTQMVIVCIPTKGIRSALAALCHHIPTTAILVSAAKGIEVETLTTPSQMIQEFAGQRPVVAFGGPCHAEEVACGKPATVVAACDDVGCAQQVQQAFSNQHLRVYSNNDLKGVELAGALKNVMAIAAGISDGLEFGDNAKSALITRGLAEMTRFGTAMGALPDTFYGLAGIGDLVATCGSRHSRNRHVGELLGQGKSLTEIEQSMHAVAEGVFTARSIRQIAMNHEIDMPIATAVYEVLFENKSPRNATVELMQRPLREE